MNEKFIRELLFKEGLSTQEIEDKIAILRQDLTIPVKLIGIGQTGVGKTELIRSIFRFTKSNIEELHSFKTNPVLSETGAFRNIDFSKPVPSEKLFHSICLESPHGMKVQFTDGPGLGESTEADNFFIEQWVTEIPKHDLLYWVVDGSSRDVSHIQSNMKTVLDRTQFRERLIVVLNKVDQILLPLDQELAGEIGWSNEYNIPSNALEDLIHTRAADLKMKLSSVVEINSERIVYCSARKRWNHDIVLDVLLKHLPEEKRIKASLNRRIADARELMSEHVKMEIAKFEKDRRG